MTNPTDYSKPTSEPTSNIVNISGCWLFPSDIPGHVLHLIEKVEETSTTEEVVKVLAETIGLLRTTLIDTLEISGELVEREELKIPPTKETSESPIKPELDPHGLGQHTKGAKLDEGKVQAGLLEDFGLALLEVGKVASFGAVKYSAGGWLEVPNGIARYRDAMWRHLLKSGTEELDADSLCTHKAAAAWNLLAEIELIKRKDSGIGGVQDISY